MFFPDYLVTTMWDIYAEKILVTHPMGGYQMLECAVEIMRKI